MNAPDIFTTSAGKLSFPDFSVTRFHADGGCVAFEIDGVHVDGFGLAHEAYKVRCTTEDEVSCRRYIEGSWYAIPPGAAGALRDICEWAVKDNSLVFAGFEEQTGLWQEYVVPSFALSGSADATGQN